MQLVSNILCLELNPEKIIHLRAIYYCVHFIANLKITEALHKYY